MQELEHYTRYLALWSDPSYELFFRSRRVQTARQRPLPTRADGDLVGFEHLDELRASELTALIGIDDLGFFVPRKHLLQTLKAEVGVHRF